MSTPLPLQTALPSWLETGANLLEFEAGIAQLELGLEGLVASGLETPETSIAAQLRNIFTPGQTPRPLEDLRQLLLGVMRRPEAAKVFAQAMARAREQDRTGWVGQARKRFATNPTTCLKQAEQTGRMVVTKLNSFGRLFIGGGRKPRANFSTHPNEEVAVRMIGNVVVGVDFLKNGPPSPKPQAEFTLIYQNGKLVDSVFHGIRAPRMAKLQSAVVKVYLNKFGDLHVGGRHWASFNKYGNYPVEAEIRDGVVVEVRILKPAANLWLSKEVADKGVKELSLVFDEKGKVIDSINDDFEPRDWEGLTDHTVVVRLSKGGQLYIGGKVRGMFTQHSRQIATIRVKKGKITQVLFPNTERIKDVNVSELFTDPLLDRGAHHHFPVYDNSGAILFTYRVELGEKQFRQLENATIIDQLAKDGTLTVGGKIRARFSGHPRDLVAIKILSGVIVKVDLLHASRLSDVKWPLEEKDVKWSTPFQLVWNFQNRLVDSFYAPWKIRVRFQNHLGKITGNFRVDAFNGFLHGYRRYYFGDDVDYRGWPLSEIVFGDVSNPGEITEFLINNPETEKTIRLDAKKYRQNLGDVAEWVVEVVPPAKGEKAIGGRDSKSALRIGPRAPSPEEEMIRAEQIARIRRALDRFTPDERELLLEVAMLYYDLRHKTLPTGVHTLWLILEIKDELDTLDIIARQLEVPREWIIRSFETLRKSLKD